MACSLHHTARARVSNRPESLCKRSNSTRLRECDSRHSSGKRDYRCESRRGFDCCCIATFEEESLFDGEDCQNVENRQTKSQTRVDQFYSVLHGASRGGVGERKSIRGPGLNGNSGREAAVPRVHLCAPPGAERVTLEVRCRHSLMTDESRRTL